MDKKIKVIIVILGCRGYHVRWPETEMLLNYFKDVIQKEEITLNKNIFFSR
jgi:hypothetical protein